VLLEEDGPEGPGGRALWIVGVRGSDQSRRSHETFEIPVDLFVD